MAGRASGLVWLSVWGEVQTCIWPSGFHCHSLSLASVKSRLVLPFWYWLTRIVPDKGPLNGCVCISFNQYLIAECVIVFCKSLPLSIPRSTFHHSYYHEVAGYTTAPREVFSLPSSLPSGDTSSSFVAWPVTRKVLFTIVYCSSYYLLV